MFDTAMTLKYNQGDWKWYEWDKLNEYYPHAKFDIYHVYTVQENRSFQVSAMYGHTASLPNTDHYTLTFSCESKMAVT